MKTQLADFVKDTADGKEAESIVRNCVHCGFCTATCPTYQVLGDELDSPRGRIYLIKEVLEGVEPTASTQLHLDRCLTCRACETTCPSGVQYGRLIDIGRKLVDEKVERPVGTRVVRHALRQGLTSALFAPAMRAGQALRPLLPKSLQAKVPARKDPGQWPTQRHARKMLMLTGCVQPSMMPNINAATARVFDALGIEMVAPATAGCCGANKHHLGDHHRALDEVRRNVDAWWPHVEAGAEAIVINASGCGAMVKEYGYLLRHDAEYAAKGARVSALACDVVEVLSAHVDALREMIHREAPQRLAFHAPCTLQHALKLRGVVEGLLTKLGVEVLPVRDAHLCCGSAGSYSVLQPELSGQLRERKLHALMALNPTAILSANIGCIAHLGAEAPVSVQHWIEWLDASLRA